MPVLHETITVPRPPGDVFAYVADFSSSEEWDPGVAAARRLDDGPLGVGSLFSVDVKFAGRISPMEYTITAFEPGHRVVLEGVGDRVKATDEILFQPADGGTRITYIADIRLRGVLRLAEPFLGGVFDSIGKKAIAGMERSLSG